MFTTAQPSDSPTTPLLRRGAFALAAAAWLVVAAGCSGDGGAAATISTVAETSGVETTEGPSTTVAATNPQSTTTQTTVPQTTVPQTTAPQTTGSPTSTLATATSVVSGDEINIFVLPEGLCFVSGAQDDELVLPVECTEDHEGQKYADVPLDIDGPYSDAAAKAVADPVCRAEFELFVGTDYDISELFYVGLTPAEADWENGYGAVCVVVAETGLLDFDAEGSNL